MPRSAVTATHRIERDGGRLRIVVGGDWTIAAAAELDPAMRRLSTAGIGEVEIDCRDLGRLDTTGAWLLLRSRMRFEAAGAAVRLLHLDPRYAPLMGTVEADRPVRRPVPQRQRSPEALLERIGRGVAGFGAEAAALLGFLGLVTVETVETVFQPRRLRVAALFRQIEETGLEALPILGLLSFLLGVVLAYQGADQLRRFGAEIFTVNLLGVSILREVGGLIAAIIVAGRSGSSFTAQIGTMKVNQEVDALRTMGMNLTEVLVLPRLIGLVIALPLLTFYANTLALIGGAVMCYIDLGITLPSFLRQLQGALDAKTLMVGLVKAPVFAFLIALVGCFEGLQVESNADSVGRLTTRSVVESIFLVIVADAGFSILFSLLGI